MRFDWLIVAAVATIPSTTFGGIPQGYVLTDLGVTQITGGGALDINDLGQVTVNLDGIGFIYDHGVLSPPGGLPNNNVSFAINDLGHATWTYEARAKYWDGSSTLTLPTLESGFTAGLNINNNDLIVGTSFRSSIGRTRGYFWNGSQMIDLGSHIPNGGSRAEGINDGGIIVGESETLPVNWVSLNLELLPLPAGMVKGTAYDINEGNQIVGMTYTDSFALRATIWNGGTPTLLGSVNGRSYTIANAINDLGQVVGDAQFSAAGAPRAFLFDGGQMYDLTDHLLDAPGWTLSQAFGINNAGEIVGVARFENQNHAFLITPVPEASSVMIGALGVLGIGVRMFRSRRYA